MKLFLLIVLSAVYIYPQCSDAGVCSIADHNRSAENILRTGLSYEFGYSGKKDDISYSSIVLKAEYNFLDNTSAHLSLPYSFQSGPLGKISGMGDPLFLLNQNIYISSDLSVNLQGGIKIAGGEDNSENLPQMYQSSLGTNDFLLGASISYTDISLAMGYQLAGGRNGNVLKVKRGDDFLFSAGYNHSFSEVINANIKLLVIKRLSETSIADSSNTGSFVTVAGSDNLQINAAITFSYRISETTEINIFGAVPFKKRPVNIDGLTRSLSLSAGAFFYL